MFILVDDLGKEWIRCYGAQEIQTPHIDRLAAGGMQFENAWCMPQCTPTRLTLLTGQYPFRHGWTNHFDVPRWGSGCHFDPRCNASFAQVLRQAGYATAIAGKWQIDDFRVEPKALDEAGFDAWCMWTGGEGGNRPSNERYHGPYVFEGETAKTRPDAFGPDIYQRFLIDFMRQNRSRPMLLYYPMCLTHTPLVATPDAPEAATALEKHQAMVRYVDKLVGGLVAELDHLGIRNNTIIFFTTDNGTSGSITGQRGGRAVKGAKAQMVEAGTCVPFIVNCPGRVPQGSTDALTDFTDILPTFADLAGAKLPRETEDEAFAVDGHSIAPLILGQAQDSPRTWILSMGGHPAAFRDGRVVPAQAYDDRVIRDKQYKLWINTAGKATKLFNLGRDPWETTNLIDHNDPAVQEARQRLEAVIQSLPKEDAAPRYRTNPPQPWDKYKLP